MKRRAEKKILW